MRTVAVLRATTLVVAAGLAAGCGAPAGPAPTTVESPASTPSSVSSPAPSADPSMSAVFPAWYSGGAGSGAGILHEGSHTTKAFLPRFTFSVPKGWVNDADDPGFYALFPDSPANQAEFARSETLDQAIHMGLRNDPYFACDEWEDNRGTTAAEITAAVAANDVFVVTDVTDVTIGGLTGKQFDPRIDPAWTESCPGDPPGFDLGDTRGRVILLDVPGRGVLVIIIASLHSAGFEDFLAGAMPVVESFEFHLG